MHKIVLLGILFFLSLGATAQTFELTGITDQYKGTIGETIKAPLRFRNLTDKPLTIIIRKVQEQIGSTQKNFFCIDGNCLDERSEDYILRLEPGQSAGNLLVALEAGLVPGVSGIRYVAYSRTNPPQSFEFELLFSVEEKPDRQNIYQSKVITVKDVYPNPSVDHANVDYQLTSDRAKAKIRVHNILGNIVGEYDLNPLETLIRIRTEELNAGIYFYTLYIDNESVMTRKLIVKK
jgi:hypothetical protein